MKVPVFPSVLFVVLFFSATACKNQLAEERFSEAKMESEVVDTSNTASVNAPNLEREFVRTVDAQFEVEDVRAATQAIEYATKKFGGFVTLSNLQTQVLQSDEVAVSADSLLLTKKYKIENVITLRVPNLQLDTVLRTIGKEVKFVDFQTLKCDDVSLQLLATDLERRRNAVVAKRIGKAIDHKGTKLSGIVDAENEADLRRAQVDQAFMNKLSLRDNVAFSTVTLKVYQRERMRREVVLNEANLDTFQASFGDKIFEGFKSGWNLLEGIITFLVRIWPVVLVLILVIVGYRKSNRRVELP
ncbi:DUF4349 domain-containing protein [Flavobacterium sp.]|uniref:DUF4349 domain-containing protein n=1 Tax=Flavobacterium sp. TaxID=239 RepID=UPI002632747C|nr:DUF4349 domain-containing protein [Flavobacterium sp.]